MPKLLFFVTEDWYFWSHRLPVAREALRRGFQVTLLTNVQSHEEKIRNEGIRVIPLSLRRRSMNPFRELMTLFQVVAVYRKLRPDIVHHVAMKPVLYGSIAAACTGVARVVNALAGLGHLFITEQPVKRALRKILMLVFRPLLDRKGACLILQNPDDIETVVKNSMAPPHRIRLIRGSGVDISTFVPAARHQPPVTVVLPARMLRDKGVVEFVTAARRLSDEGCRARFVLVGGRDGENPAAIPEEQLNQWQEEGVVEWWGQRDDMPSVFAQADIVCLPSYREGLPKALLEAAASGLPIVATDVPGCREIVRHGDNGLLVPARNVSALAKALLTLIHDGALRQKMGEKGREIVAADFSERSIVSQTLAVYEGIATS